MPSGITERHRYDMVIRKAEYGDAGAVAAIYDSVRGKGYCIWNSLYPVTEDIERGLASDSLYVLEVDGVIAGTASAVPENELDGFECRKEKADVREIARVALLPAYQGKGLSGQFISGLLREMEKDGTGAVHLSVVKTNIPAVSLYRIPGFDFRGEAFMYGHEYYLCEKKIGN